MALKLDLTQVNEGNAPGSGKAGTFLWIKDANNEIRYYSSNNTSGYSAAVAAYSHGAASASGAYTTRNDYLHDVLTIVGSGNEISIASNLQNNLAQKELVIDAAGSYKGWRIDLGDNGAKMDTNQIKVTVNGSAKADTLVGNKFSVLNGGGGDDLIAAGSDGTVLGGGGNDTLVANAVDGKHAVLTGDSGNNLFVAQEDAEVTITDFKYGRDQIALVTGTSTFGATVGHASFAAFNTDDVKIYGYGKTTIESPKDYLQYTVVDSDDKTTNVVSAKSEAAFIDLSSSTDSFQIFGGQLADNAGNNTLHGGLKNDTIYADKGDFVYGGGGNDLIKLNTPASTDDATAERVALTEAGGKDTVEKFDTGWDDNADIVWFYDKAADVSDVSVDTSGNLVLKQGKGQLTLKGVSRTDKIRVQDENGTYKLGYTGTDHQLTDANAEANIYLGTAKKDDTVSFTGAEGDIVADLGNTGKFAGSARYTSIEALVGGSGNNTLVGAAGVNNTLDAGLGSSSLYGGGKSSDLLIATDAAYNAGKSTTFFFGAGDGKDTIKGFHATEDSNPENVRDVLAFYGGDVTSVAKNGTALVVNMKDKGSIQINNAFIGLYDKLIGVDVLGQKSFAKIAGADEIVHYNSNAKYYVSVGTKGTVENSADGSKIYLDGRTGDSYKGFTNIKATAGDGLELAGDAAKNVVEYAGAGSASLYGGAGDDTLKGSTETSAVNTFFFGKKDGNDVITQSGANDKVMLYDVTLDDIKSAKVDNNVLKVGLKGSGSLTVNNFSTGSSVNEFALADGTTWNYAGGTWTQKTSTTEE